ncbi:MAG: DinB family protein [Pirellulaceae bacterium]|nr:DinB family protein [Pirellulaceae bacterium]
MSERTYLEIAIQQIIYARQYTQSLLAGIEDSLWFQMPAGSPTHLAWQVGHLAMAQYGLCLFRQRGRQEVDTQLMSSQFRKRFSKGSTPESDPDRYPTLSEIRDVFQVIYDQSMKELGEYQDSDLETPIDEPYAVIPTKLGALYFCASHEMLHAGQIGLIRRLLGVEPLR